MSKGISEVVRALTSDAAHYLNDPLARDILHEIQPTVQAEGLLAELFFANEGHVPYYSKSKFALFLRELPENGDTTTESVNWLMKHAD